MEVLNLSKEEFNSLERFIPDGDLVRNEALLYRYKEFLLKYFNMTNGDYFAQKLVNINTFSDFRDCFGPDIIIPEKLVSVDEEAVGFIMKFIPNSVSFHTIMKDTSITINEKLDLLRQAHNLVKKIHSISLDHHRVFVGDIHEGNFILDKVNGHVKLVDSDSFYFTNNKPFASKYLVLSDVLYFFHNKYQTLDNGIVIPNENSDLFCFNIMVLNLISGCDNFALVKYSNFENYLNYLESLGINKDFIASVLLIYSSADNKSILDYITTEDIPKLILANKSFYKEKTGNSLI